MKKRKINVDEDQQEIVNQAQDSTEKKKQYNKEYNKQYYQANKDEKQDYARKKSKQRYNDNKETVKAKNREYNEKNRDKILEQRKQYRDALVEDPLNPGVMIKRQALQTRTSKEKKKALQQQANVTLTSVNIQVAPASPEINVVGGNTLFSTGTAHATMPATAPDQQLPTVSTWSSFFAQPTVPNPTGADSNSVPKLEKMKISYLKD